MSRRFIAHLLIFVMLVSSCKHYGGQSNLRDVEGDGLTDEQVLDFLQRHVTEQTFNRFRFGQAIELIKEHVHLKITEIRQEIAKLDDNALAAFQNDRANQVKLALLGNYEGQDVFLSDRLFLLEQTILVQKDPVIRWEAAIVLAEIAAMINVDAITKRVTPAVRLGLRVAFTSPKIDEFKPLASLVTFPSGDNPGAGTEVIANPRDRFLGRSVRTTVGGTAAGQTQAAPVGDESQYSFASDAGESQVCLDLEACNALIYYYERLADANAVLAVEMFPELDKAFRENLPDNNAKVYLRQRLEMLKVTIDTNVGMTARPGTHPHLSDEILADAERRLLGIINQVRGLANEVANRFGNVEFILSVYKEQTGKQLRYESDVPTEQQRAEIKSIANGLSDAMRQVLIRAEERLLFVRYMKDIRYRRMNGLPVTAYFFLKDTYEKKVLPAQGREYSPFGFMNFLVNNYALIVDTPDRKIWFQMAERCQREMLESADVEAGERIGGLVEGDITDRDVANGIGGVLQILRRQMEMVNARHEMSLMELGLPASLSDPDVELGLIMLTDPRMPGKAADPGFFSTRYQLERFAAAQESLNITIKEFNSYFTDQSGNVRDDHYDELKDINSAHNTNRASATDRMVFHWFTVACYGERGRRLLSPDARAEKGLDDIPTALPDLEKYQMALGKAKEARDNAAKRGEVPEDIDYKKIAADNTGYSWWQWKTEEICYGDDYRNFGSELGEGGALTDQGRAMMGQQAWKTHLFKVVENSRWWEIANQTWLKVLKEQAVLILVPGVFGLAFKLATTAATAAYATTRLATHAALRSIGWATGTLSGVALRNSARIFLTTTYTGRAIIHATGYLLLSPITFGILYLETGKSPLNDTATRNMFLGGLIFSVAMGAVMYKFFTRLRPGLQRLAQYNNQKAFSFFQWSGNERLTQFLFAPNRPLNTLAFGGGLAAAIPAMFTASIFFKFAQAGITQRGKIWDNIWNQEWPFKGVSLPFKQIATDWRQDALKMTVTAVSSQWFASFMMSRTVDAGPRTDLRYKIGEESSDENVTWATRTLQRELELAVFRRTGRVGQPDSFNQDDLDAALALARPSFLRRVIGQARLPGSSVADANAARRAYRILSSVAGENGVGVGSGGAPKVDTPTTAVESRAFLGHLRAAKFASSNERFQGLVNRADQANGTTGRAINDYLYGEGNPPRALPVGEFESKVLDPRFEQLLSDASL